MLFHGQPESTAFSKKEIALKVIFISFSYAFIHPSVRPLLLINHLLIYLSVSSARWFFLELLLSSFIGSWIIHSLISSFVWSKRCQLRHHRHRASYSILYKHVNCGRLCYAGFSEGSIKWDDEDSENRNLLSGTLPDGTYTHDTIIYFCCRTDGFAPNAIYLPTENPFYLFKKGDQCQYVHGMQVKEEYFRWDTEDDNNSNRKEKETPKVDINDNFITLYYCYYYKWILNVNYQALSIHLLRIMCHFLSSVASVSEKLKRLKTKHFMLKAACIGYTLVLTNVL